jgi:hypothetical protein
MQNIKSLFSYLYRIQDLKKGYLFLIFAAYVILLCAAVSRHEPWMDEAQPWLLVTDFSAAELLGKYLRYEGHPALWYLILFFPAKAGLPFFTVNILSALLAAFAQWLFLRYSPFPLIIKILLPFSFFAFFQYAVVARSYCLIPPVLFLTAIRYKTKIEHPVSYALLLCLLANISVHTFLMAGMFMLLHIADVGKMWSGLDKNSKIRQIAATAIFALSSLQIILVLAPPPDQSFAPAANWNLMNFFNVSRKMFVGSLVADDANPASWLPFAIALVVLAATLALLRWKRLTLLYVLPLLSVLGFLAVKYNNVWHQGILFFLWIFVLWIRFDLDKNKAASKRAQIVLALMTVVLAVQVYWAAAAARCDFYHNYSGSFQAARYINANRLENQKIYASGWKSIAIAPYFDRKIFYNHNQNSDLRIWFWSDRNQTPVGFNQNIIDSIKSEQPDLVIIASDHLDENPALELEGYRLAEFFEGNLCWKAGTFEPDSYRIFRKSQ